MDAFATIQIVSSIIQLVDFGTKCVSKSVELYSSADGVLVENATIEKAATHLTNLNEKVKDAQLSKSDQALQDLCKDVAQVSSELLDVLDGLKVKGTKTKWKSLRKAIKSVWGKEKVKELEEMLAGFRDTLNLHICVEMRQQLEGLDTQIASRFDDCDTRTKDILQAIINQRDVFHSSLLNHTVLVRSLHEETTAQIQDSHQITRLEVQKTGAQIEEANQAEHALTRQEIQQERDRVIASMTAAHRETSQSIQTAEIRLNEVVLNTDEASAIRDRQTQSQIAEVEEALRQLSQQMQAQEAALRVLVIAMGEATSKTKRKLLRERSNAVTAAILALETMYRSLQEILEALRSSVGELIEKARSSELWQVTKHLRLSTSSRGASGEYNDGEIVHSSNELLDLKPYYAHSVYYAYHYRWIDIHFDLVNTRDMEKKWPFRNDNLHLPHANYEGISVDNAKCDSKPVWLLAAVNAAMMRAMISEDASFYLIAKVFDKSGGSLHNNPTPYSEGRLASRLRADMGYWRSFATTRGMLQSHSPPVLDLMSLDEPYGESQDSETPEITLEQLTPEDLEELNDLLHWLIGAVNSSQWSQRVSTVRVRPQSKALNVAKVVESLGLQVIVECVISDAEPGGCGTFVVRHSEEILTPGRPLNVSAKGSIDTNSTPTLVSSRMPAETWGDTGVQRSCKNGGVTGTCYN